MSAAVGGCSQIGEGDWGQCCADRMLKSWAAGMAAVHCQACCPVHMAAGALLMLLLACSDGMASEAWNGTAGCLTQLLANLDGVA